ncbi:uncharacterized protein LOC124128811 [Haliotis rufescens]|uniref:uncharacterized protein LOC124128811 n=1 Tax=Haliotis rufescens TaxID=6454 RepID=UPI001EB033E6|nr:uncharacterized protein LOC124128811 [Haliotis rufescens]
MSTLSYRNEVRFSDTEMDPVTLDIAEPFTDRSSSLSSRRTSCEGTIPRSILKTRKNVEHWLQDGSCADHDDVFHGFSKSFLPGLHEWTEWRTQMNDAMVDLIEKRHRIFSYPGSVRHLQKHQTVMKNLVEPDFLITKQASEFALQRAVHDYVTGNDGFHLQAPTFISFGLPRVRLRSNSTYLADDRHSESNTDTGSSIGTVNGSDSTKPTFDNSSITKPVLEYTSGADSARASMTSSPEIGDANRNVPQQLPTDKTVVIVASTESQPSVSECSGCDTGRGGRPRDTESLCAILDLREDSDDGF